MPDFARKPATLFLSLLLAGASAWACAAESPTGSPGGAAGASGAPGADAAPIPDSAVGSEAAAASGNAFFEALLPIAHRTSALRSQEQIDMVTTNPPNTGVTYDAEQDAARLHIPANESNLPDPSQLYVPVESDQPTGNTEWLIIWDVRYSDTFTSLSSGSSSATSAKFVRLWANDPGVGGKGFWNQDLGFKGTYLPPEFASEWVVLDQTYAGPGIVKAEPLTPVSFGSFPLRTEVWIRHWLRFTENSPLDEPKSKVSAWLADETRDATLVVDDLSLRLPWNAQSKKSLWVAHFRFAPNSARTTGPALDIWLRNVVVLKNPGPIDPYLVRPVGK